MQYSKFEIQGWFGLGLTQATIPRWSFFLFSHALMASNFCFSGSRASLATSTRPHTATKTGGFACTDGCRILWHVSGPRPSRQLNATKWRVECATNIILVLLESDLAVGIHSETIISEHFLKTQVAIEDEHRSRTRRKYHV